MSELNKKEEITTSILGNLLSNPNNKMNDNEIVDKAIVLSNLLQNKLKKRFLFNFRVKFCDIKYIFTFNKILSYMFVVLILNYKFNFLIFTANIYMICSTILVYFILKRVELLIEIIGTINSIMYKYVNFEYHFSLKTTYNDTISNDIRDETAEIIKKCIYHSDIIILLHSVNQLFYYNNLIQLKSAEIDKLKYDIKFNSILAKNKKLPFYDTDLEQIEDIKEELKLYQKEYKNYLKTKFEFKNPTDTFSSAKIVLNWHLIKEFIKIF